MTAHQELVAQIKDMFLSGMPPRKPEGFETLSASVSSPNYSEAVEETEAFWGRPWEDLELALFDQCDCVFSFLPQFATPYVFGAFMVHSLKAERFDSLALDRFLPIDPLGRLEMSKNDRRDLDWMNKRTLAPFSGPQKSVIAEFLEVAARHAEPGGDVLLRDAAESFRAAVRN